MKNRLFFTILALILISAMIPPVVKTKKNAAKANGIYSAKRLGITMNEFDAVNDHYPNQNIPKFFLSDYPQQNRDDSNYILGQLIHSQSTDSEQLFDTGLSKGSSTQADNVIFPLSELLRPGECEFSCVTIEGDEPLSSWMTKSSTPLLISHIDPNTRQFDKNCYSGEYVYLRGDNSVATGKIGPNGRPLLKGQGSKSLFENGPDTVWGDLKPKIHYPLPYELKATPSPQKIKWGSRAVVLLSLVLLVLLIFLVSRWICTPLKRLQPTPNPHPQP
jgi:hypothetical protein